MNREKKKLSLRFWVQAAVIGGVYAALTMALAPISYGPIQVRVSEALTILPYFTPAAIPGLFVGCFVANTISFYGVPDMVFGSLATLAGAFLSYRLRARPWLVPLPPIVVNGAVIGAMLYFVYGVPPSLPIDMAWVALGECLSCCALGYPLLKYLKRHEGIFRL
ncbi:MAG: QueT transporter family protein [Clostridiales Family XIII bacterium]|nr:QueT transporter family protein [Clostridiales Family XIII bacterium]